MEQKTSAAQKKAVANYRSKIKRFTTDFQPADLEIWEHLQQQPNKQAYIKSLIRADMERGGEDAT